MNNDNKTSANALLGFKQLLQNESRITKGIKVVGQTIFWIGLINFVIFVGVLSRPPEEPTPSFILTVVDMFAMLMFYAVGFGVIIKVHNAVIGERQTGTLAWLLSKPISRTALILAKIIANIKYFFIFAVIIPSLVFYGQYAVIFQSAIDLGQFVLVVALVFLHTLLYISLMLMLSTVFRTRSVILGMGIGVIFIEMLSLGQKSPLVQLSPFALIQLVMSILLGAPAPENPGAAILVTVLLSIVFVGITVRYFSWDEI